MRPTRRLLVERYYTTVSTYPHQPVHNFRPCLLQPVDLEVCGPLADDVSRCSAKLLSHNVTQLVQLLQSVYLFVSA